MAPTMNSCNLQVLFSLERRVRRRVPAVHQLTPSAGARLLQTHEVSGPASVVGTFYAR